MFNAFGFWSFSVQLRSRRRAFALLAATAALWLTPADRALAACDPASPVNNRAVTCTGATANQNGAIGYGTATDTGNTITVVSGASVTGTTRGLLFADGTVVNFGTITSGPGVGIQAQTTTANVTNFGTITGGFGISSFGTSNVTNSGTITGTTTTGVAAAVAANVTNSGSITGPVNGILSVGVANVTNSGTITGGTNGITAATVNVTNSGTITGGTTGILAAGTGNVTNSGTISGPTAISFAGSADTLTLLPGSKIIGAITLGGGGDTVGFRGGNHNLTFGTLAGATVTGTTPFVVSGNRAVAIDATPFVATGTTLGDFSRSVAAAVPVFDGQPVGGATTPMAYAAPAPSSPASVVSAAFDHMPGLSAYAADHAAFKAPTVAHADGTTFWARGFGGRRVQQADGVVLRNVSNFFGGAMGLDKAVSPNLRVGAFIGAGSTRTSIELNSGDSDSTLGFGGLYARYFFGASFLHAAVQGGGSRNDTTRNINNNLVAGGIETAKASFNGWYVSPELTLGHRIALGHVLGAHHTLTPSVQVRYLYGAFAGYTESGSTAPLTVNRQTVQSVEERAELKLTRATPLNPDSTLLLHLSGGALGTQRVGDNTVDAVLLGQEIPFATPGKDSVWGGYGGLGMEFRNGNVAAFISGEYLALNDHSSVVSGKAGMRVAFADERRAREQPQDRVRWGSCYN